MFKKRHYEAGYDFKTGFFCKLLLVLGILLIAFFLILKLFSIIFIKETSGLAKELYDVSISTVPESILAFSFIFIAIAVILYFFECQFAKLAKIADEIENNENLKEE